MRSFHPLLRLIVIALVTAVLGFGFLAGCLIVRQEKLIYMPRAYSGAERELFSRQGYAALTFRTSEGRQTAYWKAPEKRDVTAFPIWLVFSGNGGCAMDYTSLADAAPQTCGWLFIDYPGYGNCEGSPNPESIRENGIAAIDALTQHLGTSREALLPRLGAFGHSIGGAAALDLAAELQLRRAITVSTFTSMKAMAARVITPVLTPFLRHRFDNLAALERLATQIPPPQIHILHGRRDLIIPPSMGETLAQSAPDLTSWTSIDEAGHNDIIDLGIEEIVAALGGSQ